MRTTAVGRLGKVVYAHLEPKEDLYGAILDIAREHNIGTGVVLDITGGLAKVRLSVPVREGVQDSVPRVIEFEQLTETSGHGIIGRTVDSWGSGTEGIENVAGTPYAHVHVSVTAGGETYTGHLIEGCEVFAVSTISHFTIVLAEVEGVNLELRCSQDIPAGYPRATDYPNGIPVHHLEQL